MENNRLQEVETEIDAFNRQDSRKVLYNGHEEPFEWVFSVWLSAWVEKLAPHASEALRIAARGQHIGRWTSPRESYPMDRGGYLRWREELKKFHAKTVGDIMAKAGYDAGIIGSTQSIILKKNFKNDPEAQTIEDALCLVFLAHQFEDLIAKTPDEKMIVILQKTWKKMSPQGHAAALQLPFTPRQKKLIDAALA
jgi:hypothetical protein